MRNKEDLKTVRKTVLMTEALSQDIEKEAKERGIKPNAVMNERLKGHTPENSPSNMVKTQNLVNIAVKMLSQYAPEKAKYIERQMNKIW